jgi:hypothetical protein
LFVLVDLSLAGSTLAGALRVARTHRAPQVEREIREVHG